MAARRALALLPRVLCQHVGGSSRPVLSGVASPRLAAFLQPQIANYNVERSLYGSGVSIRRLHSPSQASADNEETNKYEHSKMNAEGGGSLDNFQDKAAQMKEGVEGKIGDAKGKLEDIKDAKTDEFKGKAVDVKDKAIDVKDKIIDDGSSVADTVKDHTSKEVDTAKGIFKEVSETATGLKEVGVEAAKAIKRDTGKVAEKVGLKSDD